MSFVEWWLIIVIELHLVELVWLVTAFLDLVEALHRLSMRFEWSYHSNRYLRQLFHRRKRAACTVLSVLGFESWVVLSCRINWLQFLAKRAVGYESSRIAHALHFGLLRRSRRLGLLRLVFPLHNFIYTSFCADPPAGNLLAENCRTCFNQILVLALQFF